MKIKNTRRLSFDIKFTRHGLRMLVELRGLPSDSTCVLEAEPCKLDQKKQTRYSLYQFTS